MAALLSFFALASLGSWVAAQGQEPLAFITPESIPQCGEVNFHWSGGNSPWLVTIGTTDNASVSSATVAPNIGVRNYTWGPIDLPAGTPLYAFPTGFPVLSFTSALAVATCSTFSVRDDEGSIESPVLTVQPSSNSSCLESFAPLPNSTTTSASNSLTNSGLPTSTTKTPVASPTGSSNPASPSRNSHVAVIAGVVVGVIVLLAIVIILLMIQKRRERRHNTSSKEAFVRTFGPAKADLDSEAEQDTEEMAIPDPYVFRAVSRGQSTLAIETDDLSRQPSSLRSDPAARSPSGRTTDSLDTPSTTRRHLKGERYLPDHSHSPQQTSPGGVSGRSGIQEEDIDRLAARMVAMMSAGRLADQAWTPGARGRDVEDVSVPPPMYKDATQGSVNRPGEH